jgi:ribosome-associated protein
MNTLQVRKSIEKNAQFSFCRSSGPGGQNVNKVNTKVLLVIDITKLEGLTEQELSQIQDRLLSRLKDHTFLSITVDSERSQFSNKTIALNKCFQILKTASIPVKKRVPTKVGKTAKLKRLEAKKHYASIKVLRKKPFSTEF